MPNNTSSEQNRPVQKEKAPDVTPEDIRRKEIAPHEGSTIGPSPTGNVGDSRIP